MGVFGKAGAVLCAVAALVGAEARAATLVYEATFTSTLTEARVVGLLGTYDNLTGAYVDTDLTEFTLEELGFGARFDGMEIGESRSGELAVFFDPDARDPDRRYSASCSMTGSFQEFCYSRSYSEFVSVNGRRQIMMESGDSMGGYEFRIGPDTGSYYYIDDGYYQGIAGGIFWSSFGIEYEFQFTDIRITTPAPVPLPAGGLLLASAVGAAALVRRRQMAQAKAVR